MSKKAIVIGASSGIGRELAIVLSKEGYEVGLTARREGKLKELQASLPNPSYVKAMDIQQADDARAKLAELINEMGGMDLIILISGVGGDKSWEGEKSVILTNIYGITALGNYAYHYFSEKGSGHIVGISSVASVRGMRQLPVYNASKAFLSSYMEGLHHDSVKRKRNITVCDARPGFVKTPMTAGNKSMPMLETAEGAALDIYKRIIKGKKRVAYITRRWWWMAQLMKRMPGFIFYRNA